MINPCFRGKIKTHFRKKNFIPSSCLIGIWEVELFKICNYKLFKTKFDNKTCQLAILFETMHIALLNQLS